MSTEAESDDEIEDGKSVTFNGPPEPVLVEEGDDETLKVAVPTGEPPTTGQPLKFVTVGTYRCQNCNTPTLEGEGLTDGQLKPPASCEGGCEQKPIWAHVGIPESTAQNAVAGQNLWELPGGVDQSDFEELWDDIEQFITDYWSAKEREVYAGLTAYVLSSWLRPELDFVPHIMLIGHTTGGKTRLLNTLSLIGYRSITAADATGSSLFRMSDRYNVSFFVSEYHGLGKDAKRLINSIVRAGQKRGECVTRSEQQADGAFRPVSFDPFMHAAIATQEEPPDDIINRCIQIHSSPARKDMPAIFGDQPNLEELPNGFERARRLRNRLLYMRYRLIDSEEWEECEDAAYRYFEEREIWGRSREKLLPLLTVAIRFARNDEHFSKFMETVLQQDRRAAADSQDAIFVESVIRLINEELADKTGLADGDPLTGIPIYLKDVAEKFEDLSGEEDVSPSQMGHIRKRNDLDKTKTERGVAIKDEDLATKLEALRQEHHLEIKILGVDRVDHTQENRIKSIRSLIAELEVEHEDGAPVEEVIERAAEAGVDENKVEHVIEKLRQGGDVYEPAEGHLRTT